MENWRQRGQQGLETFGDKLRLYGRWWVARGWNSPRAWRAIGIGVLLLSIVLAIIASVKHAPSDIDTSLVKQAPATSAPAPAAPASGDALSGAAQKVGDVQQGASNSAVPLAQ